MPNVTATRHKPRATCQVLRATCIFACTVAALFGSGLVCATHGQNTSTVALLPFENVSGSIESLHLIMPLVEQRLRAKGYQIIGPEKLEPFLSRNRIRNTGMMSRVHLSNLRREFGVDFALLGSIDLYYESTENPQWGISSRIVSTSEGNILWAECAGRTGGDFTKMLGLGTITSGKALAEEVIKIMFETFPAPGKPFPVSRGVGTSSLRAAVSRGAYRSDSLDTASRWRVAVAIFENASERKGAGRILTDVFTASLFNRGRFEVIDPGEVNDVLIALGRTPYGGLDFPTLREFKKRTAIDAIFIGTVYRYNEGLKREASSSPEIALDVTLLDTDSGKILWFAVGERSGDDSQIVLDFGIIRSMVPLIQKAVGEMLETL
jgi:TolB-like protein